MNKYNYIAPLVGLFLFVVNTGSQPTGTFYVTDFGALNDTSVLSTEAINRAIEQCYSFGGGQVIIPPGNYKSGTIVLKDHVDLHIQSGATLFASCSHEDFPRQKQPEYRSQKDPGGWYALIYTEGAGHISITGRGTINGQGARQVSRPEALAGDRDGQLRNILLISCKNILVEGLTLRNSGMWNQHYLNCEDVLIDHIKVYNHSNGNNDGIDIDGCWRMVLSNSIIDSDDDGIILKSTGMAPCEHVTITNCIVSSHATGIKFGTESIGGFREMLIANCNIKPSIHPNLPEHRRYINGSTGLALQVVDGGVMEAVQIDNLVIDGPQCPIFIRLGNRTRKHVEEAPEPPIGSIRNVQISNITAINIGNFSASVTGIPGGKIESVCLSNIRIISKGRLKSGDYISEIKDVEENEKGYPSAVLWGNLPSSGLFIRHVKNISLSGISFRSENTDPRPVVVASDVDTLRIRDMETDKVNQKTILLESVKKLNVDPELEPLIILNQPK